MQKIDAQTIEEIIRKYRWAGRIRFISFALLLLFLILMKYIGGYSYLNATFIVLICIEAVLNQPHSFLVKHADIRRFQYYQMTTDIIAISWIVHYMGGLEAPIISIAYYAVILWAGVVSTTAAVFFSVITSVVFFSSVILLEYFGLLPLVSYFNYKMPMAQMISLLLGNVSFLFAFGYFSSHSSNIIKFLQRKRQEESLRNVNKLVATGSLVGYTAHDALNILAGIKGYVDILINKPNQDKEAKEMLESIRKLELRSADLLERLAAFSKKTESEFYFIDVHNAIEDALEVSWPLVRYSKMKIEKKYGQDIPKIMANKGQLQEAFVVFIINSMDAISGQGMFTIETIYRKEDGVVEIVFWDTGVGIRHEDLKHLGEPFFTTKGSGKSLGIGLAAAYGIINRHNGRIKVESQVGKGTKIIISLKVTGGGK